MRETSLSDVPNPVVTADTPKVAQSGGMGGGMKPPTHTETPKCLCVCWDK